MRYHRQTLLPQIGPQGQARLARARVMLIGCGALGTTIAEQLARAGVGLLKIADRDIVELTNLQRQVLFDESDAAQGLPKAVAAARRLTQINSSIVIEPHVLDVHAGNIEELAGLCNGAPVDLVLDGTDNVQTRYLINDVSVKHGLPWIYGACVGMEGRVMAIRPPETPCLRCIFPQPPAAGELPTCDTAGVFGPAASVVASLQAAAAIRLLVGNAEGEDSRLFWLDVWRSRFGGSDTRDVKPADCIACGQKRFEFLEQGDRAEFASLCGRDAVQVRPPIAAGFDLDLVCTKLSAVAQVERTPYLLRCDLLTSPTLRLTVFPDGRAIVQGTKSVEQARSVYARFIGS